MAFPTIQTSGTVNSNNTAGTNTKTVGMPSGVTNGDLVVIILTKDGGTGTSDITTPASGWTELYDLASGSANPGLAQTAWYRFCDGTEPVDVTVTFTSGVAEIASWVCYRVSGALAIEAGVPAVGVSDTPDPPSLTPSWGSEDTLWLAVMGWDGWATVTNHSGYPPNYSIDQRTAGTYGGSAGAGTSVAGRELAAASTDPDAFLLNSSNRWIANTIAIRPIGGGGSPQLKNYARKIFNRLIP